MRKFGIWFAAAVMFSWFPCHASIHQSETSERVPEIPSFGSRYSGGWFFQSIPFYVQVTNANKSRKKNRLYLAARAKRKRKRKLKTR